MMDVLISPFTDYGFMRRALAAILVVGLAAAPSGVFLMQRRMSLVAASLVHGAMPGVAVAFVLFGGGALAMTIGGFTAALAVAWGAALITRLTPQGEDASLAAIHLIFFALGVAIIGLFGNFADIEGILFGRVLAIDNEALFVLASLASVALILLALIYRPLVLDSFDPGFMASVGGSIWARGMPIYFVFLALICAQLVAGIQAIGLLLMVGIMMLPATAARFWAKSMGAMILVATLFAVGAGFVGLLCSFYWDIPSGPAVICAAGLIYLVSVVIGPRGGIVANWRVRHSNGALVGVLVIAASFAQPGPAAAQDRPQVVATFSILGDMVRVIGGDHIDLVTLIGPGGDAHQFDPRPSDARSVGAADLVVANGLGFERFLDRLVASTGYDGLVVTASTGVTARHFESAPAVDPHAWHDLENARRFIENITVGLATIDPARADTYRANAAAYNGQLDELEAELTSLFAPIIADRRRIVTSHDSFGYFGAAFDLQFLGAGGVSTSIEPSAGEIAGLVDLIRDFGVRAIFVETLVNSALINEISRETGVAVGGTLYGDTLSTPDGPAPSFIAMMRHNARTIASALNGS